mmetsp:Transcript_42864/g.119307  ORF Transcript_42864/g.119307 Transcript_42864/m.119307 type:complete len:275 (+) Transcript_42864:343-1167(+)
MAAGSNASPRSRSDCAFESLPHRRTVKLSPGLYPTTSTWCCHFASLPASSDGVRTSEPESPRTRQLQKILFGCLMLLKPYPPRKMTLRTTMSEMLTSGRAMKPGTAICTSSPSIITTRPFRPCTVVTVWPTRTVGGFIHELVVVETVALVARLHTPSSPVFRWHALPIRRTGATRPSSYSLMKAGSPLAVESVPSLATLSLFPGSVLSAAFMPHAPFGAPMYPLSTIPSLAALSRIGRGASSAASRRLVLPAGWAGRKDDIVASLHCCRTFSDT